MKHQKIQALIFWCDRKMSGMILNFDGNEISQKEFETYKKTNRHTFSEYK